jgi:MFS transporter, CP family, cyanate transporter
VVPIFVRRVSCVEASMLAHLNLELDLMRSTLIKLIALIAVVAIMRPPIAQIGPLLPEIRSQLDLSTSLVGWLTTIPILCFGILAFFTPKFVSTFGVRLGVWVLLLAIAVGILLRVNFSLTGLMVGTVVISVAIALLNAVIPTFVKEEFPQKISLMTGVYTTAMASFAALSASIAVPVAQSHTWQFSLEIWALPAIIAIVLWSTQLQRSVKQSVESVPMMSLFRNRDVWAIGLLFGTQSIGFYATLAWLPTILQTLNFSAVTAGNYLALMTLIGIPMGIFMPAILRVLGNSKNALIMSSLSAFAGIVGLALFETTFTPFWILLMGIGFGSAFPLILNVITLRASNPAVTTSLSSFAQGVGYFIAAVFSYLIGVIGAYNWTIALLVFSSFMLMQFALTFIAARAEVIDVK